MVSRMMGPGVGIGMCPNHGPYARVRKTGFRSRGAREGAHRDRVLADLALGLRGLDLPSFTREVVRCAREGLGVEHCEVSRFLTEGSREPGFGWTVPSRENGMLGGISVVVCANDRAFGILSAYSASRRRYTEEEAGFLQDVAGLLGMAVERALSAEAHRLSLEKERRRAEAAEEKYAFLHEANAVLTAAPDGLTALAAAARLAVPALADSCFVDVVEGGVSRGWIRRLVVARSGRAGDRPDPELVLCYPLDTNAPHGTPKVLRTGQPELIPDLPDGLLRSLACGRDHLELMRDLAPGSYLCVPLQAGLRLIGSIGFVSSRSGRGGRRYGPEDLGLARCLARCTALVAASSLGRSPARARAPGKGAARLWDADLDAEPVLTPRQLEVLRLLDGGMRVHQIKVELGLSEPTVRTHVRAILRAFGACSQLEALHKARVFGFVDGITRNAAADRSP
jgi:DNA-binding CsgD family transcriptional regulator